MKDSLRTSIDESFAILDNKLSILPKWYEVEISKGVFPYSFANENTLFYLGWISDIKWYENIYTEDYDKLVRYSSNFL